MSEKLVPLFSRSLPNITVRAEKRSLDHNRDDFDFISQSEAYLNFFSKISKEGHASLTLQNRCETGEFLENSLRSLGAGPLLE